MKQITISKKNDISTTASNADHDREFGMPNPIRNGKTTEHFIGSQIRCATLDWQAKTRTRSWVTELCPVTLSERTGQGRTADRGVVARALVHHDAPVAADGATSPVGTKCPEHRQWPTIKDLDTPVDLIHAA